MVRLEVPAAGGSCHRRVPLTPRSRVAVSGGGVYAFEALNSVFGQLTLTDCAATSAGAALYVRSSEAAIVAARVTGSTQSSAVFVGTCGVSVPGCVLDHVTLY